MCLTEAIDRTINLGRRASAARDLMSALKMVITLERQALRINEMTNNINLPAAPSKPHPVVTDLDFEEMFAKIRNQHNSKPENVPQS